MKNNIHIGCVADDFTGASDAASFLLASGLKTLLVSGIPQTAIPEDCEAVVIALKSRTQKTTDAVRDSLEAFDWLVKNNAQHLYFKYCSTFDSTKEGNIGPVLDAALEKYNTPYSILCPALPVNKRIVKNGELLVDGLPLNESHMKDHPLTPMWAAKIDVLMKEQGKYPTLDIDYTMLEKNTTEIKSSIEEFAKSNEHFYVVPDYIEDEHAEKIVEVFGDNYILSGGSGGASLNASEELHQKSADLLEKTMASLAKKAVDSGFKRIISAGGETSSAITKHLGFTGFIIGKSIAPGVPIMIPVENQDIRLVLKSGNFGQEDFFTSALEMTKA